MIQKKSSDELPVCKEASRSRFWNCLILTPRGRQIGADGFCMLNSAPMLVTTEEKGCAASGLVLRGMPYFEHDRILRRKPIL